MMVNGYSLTGRYRMVGGMEGGGGRKLAQEKSPANK